jgi:uncharacterized protein (DUF4415 family)
MERKRNPSELDHELLAHGTTYDASTDEYVSPEGHRISYEEWHEPPPPRAGMDVESSTSHRPITEADLSPRNVREKMSVWFDQDVLDELRRIAAATPGKKMARLINDALRAAYLPHTIPAPSPFGLSAASRQTPVLVLAEPSEEMQRVWSEIFKLKQRLGMGEEGDATEAVSHG